MKNYYRILGVKKDASEEKIREHWVEWMRKLHPDQRIEGAEEDERIKEVNEAYQVLKHSSTRVEYDLKRAYDHKKRGLYFQKLSVPIGIVIILIALATVYLKRPNITIEQALITQDQINEIDHRNQKDPKDQINQTDQPNQKDQTNQKSVISDQGAVISDQRNQINQKDPPQKRIKPSPPRRNDATMPKLDEASKPTTQLPNNLMTKLPNDPITQLHNDPTPQRLNDLTASINEKNQTNQINQINQIDKINQTDQINQIDQRDQENQINQVDAPTQQPKRSKVPNDPSDRNVLNVPLIATEEEVRLFFANYTERYTQKDLDSFISLFSSRAVQNRQDGSEGIRKIYDNFLKQSQEIKYRMDNISVEIYQNGVEVKARYELVQIMKKSGEKKVWRGDIRWSLIKEEGTLKILSLDYQHQKSP